MAPERASGQDGLHAHSDIYRVGALAYFLLTGQPPFAGRSGVKMLAAHLYESPASLTTQRTDVPPALEAVIVRCLGKNPADRFPAGRRLEARPAACDPIGRWTEQDATEWWRRQAGSQAPADWSQRNEEAGRTKRCT